MRLAMIFRRLTLIIFVTTFYSVGIFAQTDLSHSCRSDEDCESRLSQRWPFYRFQCCTSILCNEVYGYYLVHSGCTAERDCQPENQVRIGNRLAARIPISLWMPREQRLMEDCPGTRNDFSSLQNVRPGSSVSVVRRPSSLTPSSVPRPAVRRPSSLTPSSVARPVVRRPSLFTPSRPRSTARTNFGVPNGINPTRMRPAPIPPRSAIQNRRAKVPSRTRHQPAPSFPPRQRVQPKTPKPRTATNPPTIPTPQPAAKPVPTVATASRKVSFPRNHKGECPRMQRLCVSVGKRQDCCVMIQCKPQTIRELDANIPGQYRFVEKCMPKCDLKVERYGSTYNFYFPYEIWWGNRDRYWNYALEPPEKNCAETRYFFNFIKDEDELRR